MREHTFRMMLYPAVGFALMIPLGPMTVRAENTSWVGLGESYCDPNDPPATSFFDCVHWNNNPPCCCGTCNTFGEPVCKESCADACEDTATFGSGVGQGPTDDQPPHEIYFGSFCRRQSGLCPGGDVQIAAGNAVSHVLQIENEDWVFDFGPGGYGCSASDSTTGSYVVSGGCVVGTIRSDTGSPGDAALLIRNGRLGANYLKIGDQGATGALSVVGTGASLSVDLNSGSFIDIGQSGEAFVEFEGGAIINTNSARIVDSEFGTAHVTLRDPGTVWTTGGFFTNNGHATIQVLDGAVLHDLAGATLGFCYGCPTQGGCPCSGDLLVDGLGSALDIQGGQFFIGYLGAGSLMISNSASVTSLDGIIGVDRTTNGLVTVRDPSSSWKVADVLVVGSDGAGTLVVEQAGSVTSNAAQIGSLPNSTGSVTVNGSESKWNILNDLVIGASGHGNLQILNGSTVASGATQISLWPGSSGEVTVSGRGSTLIHTGGLGVGGPDGTLSILDGGKVIAQAMTVGGGTSSKGKLNVNGEGSLLDLTTSLDGRYLFVSDYGGQGAATISAGGKVRGGFGVIGYEPMGTGNVTVTGVGSEWDVTTEGGMIVGWNGTGTLLIEAGGRVQSGSVEIGLNGTFEGSGSVKVTGLGSELTTALFEVAREGNATLTIENGAVASGDRATIGEVGPAVGLVEVAGAGSKWTLDHGLRVGEYGRGTLSVTDGASVIDSNCVIGEFSGSEGTVNVNGGGSHWETSELTVGREGVGELNVSRGGRVSIGSKLEVARNGTVNVSRGGSIMVGNCGPRVQRRSNAIFVCPGGTLIADGTINARVVDLTRRPLQ